MAGFERPAGEHDPVLALDAKTIAMAPRPCGKRPSGRPSRKRAPSTFARSSSPSRSIRALAAGVRRAPGGGPCLVLVAPGTSRIAMRRLVRSVREPRAGRSRRISCSTSARPRSRSRGAIRSRLSVKVRPGDKIPESAQATYYFADGEDAGEPLRSIEGGEFRGRIESVNQPFHFTVTAGDDPTSIRDVAVKVVPPPTLKSLAVRLILAGVHRDCRPRCSPRA